MSVPNRDEIRNLLFEVAKAAAINARMGHDSATAIAEKVADEFVGQPSLIECLGIEIATYRVTRDPSAGHFASSADYLIEERQGNGSWLLKGNIQRFTLDLRLNRIPKVIVEMSDFGQSPVPRETSQ